MLPWVTQFYTIETHSHKQGLTTELIKDESGGDIKAELSETELVARLCVCVCVRQLIEYSNLTAQGLIRDLGHSMTQNIMLRRRLLQSQAQFCQEISMIGKMQENVLPR